MKYINDDRGGIGKIKDHFVYVSTDEYGGLNCGINIVNGSEYGEYFLSEWKLIDKNIAGEVDFFNSVRSPLDSESGHKVAVLTKEEVGKMIESLQDVYNKMK